MEELAKKEKEVESERTKIMELNEVVPEKMTEGR